MPKEMSFDVKAARRTADVSSNEEHIRETLFEACDRIEALEAQVELAKAWLEADKQRFRLENGDLLAHEAREAFRKSLESK